ncbi:MAG: transposase [Candidatus Brocadia carolinensis]|uniref:Transposase n=1 Tax=Candidatus Brocadia carolinensis TaxID=1004156 RepID=A0A1V4AV44_9BACT|nr:MAG: transposase [Candidatus Brocadia caroliniensis]
MFQDEVRFGRMSDPRACWAPSLHRPVVSLALVREFKYEHAAVSSCDGDIDHITREKINTENMSCFLKQVSKAHPDEFHVTIVNGASSHKGKELRIPKNMALVFLPPNSSELNTAEQPGNKLRRNYFANRVFDSLDAAIGQAERGLIAMVKNKEAVRNLTNWPWISAVLITQ